MEKTVVPAQEKIDEPHRDYQEDGQQIPGWCVPSSGESTYLPVPIFNAYGNFQASLVKLGILI